MEHTKQSSVGKAIFSRLIGILCALAMTVAFFLVLPMIQAISAKESADTVLTTVDTAALPPPPPPPPDEPEPDEPEEEEPPPEMMEEAPPLNLDQLELALNPGIGDGWFGAEMTLDLKGMGAGGAGGEDDIVSLADLDQPPRATYQPSPTRDAKTRKLEGTVYVLFVVDQNGRVQDPRVHKSTEPAFDRAAVAAVKKWRFEPGKKNGKPVQFRMRVPITFPKG